MCSLFLFFLTLTYINLCFKIRLTLVRAKHNPSSYGHKNYQFLSLFNTDLGAEMSRPPPQRSPGSMRAARL